MTTKHAPESQTDSLQGQGTSFVKTVVLDDDPTGTQSATDVQVILDLRPDQLRHGLATVLEHHDAVYVQTNSRAVDEPTAVQLVSDILAAVEDVTRDSGTSVRFVLRGDSTLRGHVFAESEVFATPESVLLFVPAFPDGGRTTREGVHYVRSNGTDVPAHETEYAEDPVFPFKHSFLKDYVADKSGKASQLVSLAELRAGALSDALINAPAGSVVIPDVESNDDVVLIAEAVRAAWRTGKDIVVRGAAPIAAALASVQSSELLEAPLSQTVQRALVACGSHTQGATAQLAELAYTHGQPIVIPTEDALRDPELAGRAAADQARIQLREGALAVVTTERVRSDSHNTLTHGELVMKALATAVHELAGDVDAVVAKGGITSAEMARTALGATTARVRGQIAPGISVWDLEAFDGRHKTYVVVPGNLGGPQALVDVVRALGH